MSTEMIVQLVAIILGSNWIGAMLMEIYKTKKKKKTPAEVILKSLARSHLLQSADYYHQIGYIPSDEYDDIIEEYKAYHGLKGNGRVEREYGKGGLLESLPVK